MQAYAQPLCPRAESIESTVANADYVVVAKLVDFRRGEQADERKGHDATIVIEETLKKDIRTVGPYRRLGIYIPRPASVLADWKKRSCRLLVAYNEYSPKAPTVIELDQDRLEVMTADVKLLRDPEAVIQAARETVRRMPAGVKRIHTHRLQVPRKVVTGTEWEHFYETGGHLILSVPVDKLLEKRAHNYIRSRSAVKRAAGAQALRYFKSDANIARVTPLLDDSEPTYVQSAYENKGEERVYGVRYEAYQTLKSWGIDVEEPVIREEIRKSGN